MANELPFRLPVRAKKQHEGRQTFQLVDASGYVIADQLLKDDADAIVASLNGYAAMREALIKVRDGIKSTRFGDYPNELERLCVAALNPPAAKEARDE